MVVTDRFELDVIGVVGSLLSLGYGFVEYKTASAAKQALKKLQHASIDGHQVELKVSNRATM